MLAEQIIKQGLLERLDVNKDKKVERSEGHKQYSDRFDELDADGDGLLTQEDIERSR